MKKFSTYVNAASQNSNSALNDYYQVYFECQNLLEDIRKQSVYVNEGIFDTISSWIKKGAAQLFTISKSCGFLGSSEKKDDRSKYEIALDDIAKEKQKAIEGNREKLLQQKDQLKAAAVRAKGALELKMMNDAHNEMMKAIQAQIDQLNAEKKYWDDPTTPRMTKQEAENRLAAYNDTINHLEGKEKSKAENTRDLIAGVLWQSDENGNVVYIGDKPDKIKKYLEKHPEVAAELTAAGGDAKKLVDGLSSEEAKALAQKYASDVQHAFSESPEAINTEETKIAAEEAQLGVISDTIDEIKESRREDNEAKEKIAKLANDNQKLNKLKAGNFGNALNLSDDELKELGDYPTDPDKQEKYKKKYLDKVNAKLKALGVDKKLTINDLSVNDKNEVGIVENVSNADEIKQAAETRMQSNTDTLNNDKDKAKELGFDTRTWPPDTSNGKVKIPAEPPLSKELAEQIAKQKFKTDNPSSEQIEECRNNDIATQFVQDKRKDIDEQKSELEEKKKKIKAKTEKFNQRMAEARQAAIRRQNEEIDKEFTAEMKQAENDYIAGIVVNKDGEEGYYDKNNEWQARPDINDTEKRKKWQQGLTQALLNPSPEQKKAMEAGLNKQIKIEKDDDGNPVYIVLEDGKDPVTLTGENAREEAIEIQKQHLSAKKSQNIHNHIKRAYEEGEDFEKLIKEYPELKDLGEDALRDLEKDFDDLSEEETNDEENDKLGDDVELDGEAEDDEEKKDPHAEREKDDKGNFKRVNPAKVWHKRKKKSGGTTKNYYKKDKHGNWLSITPKEYHDEIESYKKYLTKHKKQNAQGATGGTGPQQSATGGTGPTTTNSSQYSISKNIIVERFYPEDITAYLKKYFN